MGTPSHDPRRHTATFVLVPGAGGDGWYWHRVTERLRARGQRAVAVDLPAADDTAGLDAYAEVIVEAIGGARGVVLVAHSMAGFSAPLACMRTTVDLLVLVNAMIPAPGETGGQWWDATGQGAAQAEAATARGRDPDTPFDPLDMYFHDMPEDVVAAALRRGEPHQSDRPFADPFPLPRWPQVPTRVLVGRDDRLFPAAFQRRVAEERLGITPDELAGGHLVALADPAGVTDRLVAYWEEASASASRTGHPG